MMSQILNYERPKLGVSLWVFREHCTKIHIILTCMLVAIKDCKLPKVKT